MTREIIFLGAFCRIVRVEDVPNLLGRTTYLVEEIKGMDGMGQPKWDSPSTGRLPEIFHELGAALDAAHKDADHFAAQAVTKKGKR
jgi:hypothetical protein